MIAFPSMLTNAAAEVGMKIPEDPDDFVPDEFPRFHLFCQTQLGKAMSHGAHWENAKVIMKIPEENLRTVTMTDLETLGWVF